MLISRFREETLEDLTARMAFKSVGAARKARDRARRVFSDTFDLVERSSR
ncbi:MAG: hypothetical protein AB7O52_05705 [Planctomycetota bacterium]